MGARDAFLGSWRLERMTMAGADGVAEPLGTRPAGLISYGADGFMSVHLIRGADGDAARMSPHSGYFGPYTVDAAAGTVTHHIENASRPEMRATDQVRHYRIEGDRLTLSAALASGAAELQWRRVKDRGKDA